MFAKLKWSFSLQTILGTASLVGVLFFGFVVFSLGIRMMLGMSGIRIDVRSNRAVTWRRNLFFMREHHEIVLNKQQHVEVGKGGTAGPFGHRMVAVSIADTSEKFYLEEFPALTEALAFAQNVSQVTGLPVVERMTPAGKMLEA